MRDRDENDRDGREGGGKGESDRYTPSHFPLSFFQFNSHLPPTEFHHSLSSLSQSFTPKLEMQMQEIKEEKESV